MMDELTTTCYRCGAQGATKYVESLNAWVHHDMRRCVSALRANAKAAEKRVAELEAQLAAQEWRPVTEKPSQAGYYQTVNDGIYEHCYYGPNGWEDYYLTPTHWRPLTDPPLTGES